MAKVEIYSKKSHPPKLPPNLADWEKTSQTFDWKDVKSQLDWFKDDKFNAAYNAVDRHGLGKFKNKVALYYVPEEGEGQEFTFWQLQNLSNQIANILKKLGIEKGQRVFIFLPRIPQLYYGFLGIIKTGAVAGTLFQAFGPSGIQDRLGQSGAVAVITNQEMKERIYKVKENLPDLKHIIIVDGKAEKQGEVDLVKEMEGASVDFDCVHMEPEDYAFMLYTSGTTGKPKGVMHSQMAILQEHLTAKWVLDIKEDDIYWCTADPGWVTGIAYEILGSMSIGASTVIHGGRFDPAKWYAILQRFEVTVWYTAPTALRMLMKAGEKLVKNYDLSKLRFLGSVGEPLNPEVIRWGLKVFGLPFHDNWWQTETGAICIANYSCMDIKLGSMGKPVPGLVAGIVDDKGNELPVGKEGNLALKPGWPSMMASIWRRPQKYESYFVTPVINQGSRRRRGSYFERSENQGSRRRRGSYFVKEWYITGDRAIKDKDGYFWFIGRADDVIKTSGERVGPFEVESAIIEHPACAEAGVIGKPDPERGEIIKAFVVLKPGQKGSEALKGEISEFVKNKLAGHAYPREVEFVESLPKTRSGKIMRRVLKAKELGLPIGDTSTLEEY